VLTVLVPSRGRERQAAELLDTFHATKARADTILYFVLDENEPDYDDLPVVRVDGAHSGQGMGPALNGALWNTNADIIGFVGDDHRFRSNDWDETVIAANAEMGGGLIYGNDLLRGEELPSQVFIDARIVRALGWMALPGANHLYLDDTWRSLGHEMDRLKYLPDVVIEHLHPTAGKAEWDEGYRRVNEHSMYEHDAAVFHNWSTGVKRRDAQTALAALG
jgi:hypothetical protein